MNEKVKELSPAVVARCVRDLRDAREAVAVDPTSTAAFIAIERLGAALVDDPTATLGKSRGALVALLAKRSPLPHGSRVAAHATLVDDVRCARNDRVHVGAAGRRAAMVACELAVRLEGALMQWPETLAVSDIMASPVVTAEGWQTLYELRRVLLAGGYSALPWYEAQGWRIVTAGWIVRAAAALCAPPGWAKTTLADAVASGVVKPPARCPQAKPCDPLSLVSQYGVVLVAEGSRPLGIVTTTDRLAALRA